MNVKEIQQEIKKLKEKMDIWPGETSSEIDDRLTMLDLTDTHFASVETNLNRLLNHCKMLPDHEQTVIHSSLKEFKNFVENKFIQAESELKQIKSKMDYGRNHAQAIRAYTKF